MSTKQDPAKTAKLAAALKDNLKRRKAQARARAGDAPAAKALGTAPQAGPQKGPNADKKR